MKADRKTLVLAAIMACLVGGALALVSLGGDEDTSRSRAATAAAPPAASGPVEVALKPAHRSGVSGTATLVSAGARLTVTLKLSKRVPDTLLAHIHTGPCSDEPTWTNPRIWATLTDVVDGRSETTTDIVTLQEVQGETSSINVHDAAHGNRPLVCGDIPRAS